jgi:hypothetical protein
MTQTMKPIANLRSSTDVVIVGLLALGAILLFVGPAVPWVSVPFLSLNGWQWTPAGVVTLLAGLASIAVAAMLVVPFPVHRMAAVATGVATIALCAASLEAVFLIGSLVTSQDTEGPVAGPSLEAGLYLTGLGALATGVGTLAFLARRFEWRDRSPAATSDSDDGRRAGPDEQGDPQR